MGLEHLAGGGIVAALLAAVAALWTRNNKLHDRIDELQTERVKDKEAEIERLRALQEVANEREDGEGAV